MRCGDFYLCQIEDRDPRSSRMCVHQVITAAEDKRKVFFPPFEVNTSIFQFFYSPLNNACNQFIGVFVFLFIVMLLYNQAWQPGNMHSREPKVRERAHNNKWPVGVELCVRSRLVSIKWIGEKEWAPSGAKLLCGWLHISERVTTGQRCNVAIIIVTQDLTSIDFANDNGQC